MFGISEVAPISTPSCHSLAWGKLIACASLEGSYSLEKLEILPKAFIPLHFYLEREGTYFIEEGEVMIRQVLSNGKEVCKKALPHSIFSFQRGDAHSFYAEKATTLYLFSSEGSFADARFTEKNFSIPHSSQMLGDRPFDSREKYWGRIETIVSQEFAGKRILMYEHTQSSLEFHCHKAESYFVHSGKLKIGLRYGRAQNRSVILQKGQSYTLLPGLMHMRIALEETVLFEISTRDSDLDSHLVEDGKHYQHKEET